MNPSRGSGGCRRGRSFPHPRSQSTSERRSSQERVNQGMRGGRGGFNIPRGPGGDQNFRRAPNNQERAEQVRERNFPRRIDGADARENRDGNFHRDHAPKPMGYGRLKEWATTKDAGQLVLFMSTEREQLETFLKEDKIKTDWMILLVQSVNHAITAQHQKESIKQLLDSLCKNHFFEKFKSCVVEKVLLGSVWTDAEEFFMSLINIMTEILNKVPQHADKCFTGAQSLLHDAPSVNSLQDNTSVLDAITDVLKRAKEVFLQEKEKEKQQRGCIFFGSTDSEQPPENFLDIPVVPSGFDLREDSQPFIRSAKIVGEYENLDHYLDVQFR